MLHVFRRCLFGRRKQSILHFERETLKHAYSIKTLFFVCLFTAVAVAAGTLLGVYFAIGGREGAAVLAKVSAVRRVIDGGFVGRTDWTAVSDAAAEGMIEALDDRWSYYMTAEEYASYRDRSSNTSSGIGVTVQKREETGAFEIMSVTEGSPAAQAGVQPGWLLLELAGESVTELDASALRERIFAQEGDFEAVFDDGGTQRRVTLHTDSFYSSPVTYRMLSDGVGYIRIANFESGAAEDSIVAIEALAEEGITSLIFDVRTDPGGQLTELTDLLDYILPEGDIFVSVDKDGKERVTTSDASCIDYPLAVLIDANTYSAAEFFAAALREYDRAVLIGQPSTGKGRSQSTYELADGSAVHISTRRYLTPDRVDLSEQGGLTPDFSVELGEEGDTQLEFAEKYFLDRKSA